MGYVKNLTFPYQMIQCRSLFCHSLIPSCVCVWRYMLENQDNMRFFCAFLQAGVIFFHHLWRHLISSPGSALFVSIEWHPVQSSTPVILALHDPALRSSKEFWPQQSQRTLVNQQEICQPFVRKSCILISCYSKVILSTPLLQSHQRGDDLMLAYTANNKANIEYSVFIDVYFYNSSVLIQCKSIFSNVQCIKHWCT